MTDQSPSNRLAEMLWVNILCECDHCGSWLDLTSIDQIFEVDSL